jgi:hypothetical protein
LRPIVPARDAVSRRHDNYFLVAYERGRTIDAMTNIDEQSAAPRFGKRKSKEPKRRESWPKKAQRHGVCTRTLDRWAEKGIIKKPTIVQGRKYGDADEEPRHERKRTDLQLPGHPHGESTA